MIPLKEPKTVKNLSELACFSSRTNSKTPSVWCAVSVIKCVYVLLRKLFLVQVEFLKRLWKNICFWNEYDTSIKDKSFFIALTGAGQLVEHLPQSEKLLVQFPVRAYAWVASLVPGWDVCERQLIDVSLLHWCFSPSLSPSLPLSPKINK